MDRDSENIVLELVLWMGKRGIRYLDNEVDQVFDYVRRMLKDKRILIIRDDKKLKTVLFFSVCDDYKAFLKKPTWEYKEHDPKGRCIYFEKGLSYGFDKSFRNEIQKLILSMYPQLKVGKWHRYGRIGDREVTTKEYKHAL